MIDGALGKYGGKAAPPVEAAVETEPFRIVDMGDLARDARDAQVWYWAGYIPAAHVTLLGGHGGAGKSTLALHLAACVAMGVEAFGRATKRSRVLFFSAEDPADLVLWRLRRICGRLGFALDEVQQWLQVLDACDLDPVLFAERRIDGMRHGLPTLTYRALSEYVEREGFGLVIVDNASDVYDADEINRAIVRAFIRCLVQLVRARAGAVLLLAHVDRLTSRAGKLAGGESYSRSTAWHNSVRSRLFLLERDPGELELLHQKCNLGPKLPPLRLEWPDGDVMHVAQVGGFVAAVEARNDTKALLRLLHEFAARGEHVTTATTSRTHAAVLFAKERAFPAHLKAADVFALLRDAERDGLISRTEYRGADRKPCECWTLTPKGDDLLGNAATAATSPGGMGGERAQKSARRTRKDHKP